MPPPALSYTESVSQGVLYTQTSESEYRSAGPTAYAWFFASLVADQVKGYRSAEVKFEVGRFGADDHGLCSDL